MLPLLLTFLLLSFAVGNDNLHESDSSLHPNANDQNSPTKGTFGANFRLLSTLRRLIPSMTTFKAVVLAFLAISQGALSARTCLDHRVPVQANKPFGFCIDYSGSEACLAPMGSKFPPYLYPSETTAADQFNKIKFGDQAGTCPELVQRLMCTKADPWASSIVHEDNDLIPYLCPEFSSLIWQQCSNVDMTPNPFSTVDGSSGTKLNQLFANQDEFTKAFTGEGQDDNCYGGVPVDQTKPIPNLPLTPYSRYLGQVCLQRLKFTVGNRQFLLGGAPYPNYEDLMAIVDKDGIVSIWNVGGPEITAAQWLDISKSVFSDPESGLLSLVFHKNFEKNGRLFLSFNCRKGADYASGCNNDGDHVIDEYYVANPSEFSTPVFAKRILVVDGMFRNNYGGQLLFSPSQHDGNLFVFLGDGGQNPNDDVGDPLNTAQDLKKLRGKVLRINIDVIAPYAVPNDNPFVDIEGVREEIYAFGLKNPWRCAFDRLHPEFLFCADVGQHDYEEMSRIIPGGNYGWRVFEGRHLYNCSNGIGGQPFVFPQIEYRHAKSGAPAAIIGGYVYRPQRQSKLDGTYFFADEFGKLFSAISVPGSGVYRLTPAAGQWVCASDSPVPCGKDIGLVYSFFETQSGEVFVSTSQAIFKITDPERCGLN